MYSHPAYMTYVTGSGKVRDTLPNGESSIDEIAGSEFAGLPPTTHAGQNIGETAVKDGRNKQQRTWGLTISLATPGCVQKLQTASHVTSCVFSESRMR